MNEAIIEFLTTQAPAVWVLALGWYFMVKYFMNIVDKKDIQNQANLDRFISLVEKTNDVIGKFSNSLDGIHPKLHEIHEDIKSIKNK